jgi:ribosome biogenesis GTPase / thiamine phosphate phosphatase
MNFNEWDRLRPIGLTQAVMQSLASLDTDGEPMRVTEVHRDNVVVFDGETDRTAQVLPVLRRSMPTLAVGDWVTAKCDEYGALRVESRMPPLTELVRRNSAGERQVLVSNVDTALLTMGLDGDFNLRRLERYLAMVVAAGIWPVVVLTKADLCPDVAQRCEAVSGRVGRQVNVHAVNALDSRTAVELGAYMGSGQTLVLLGSSGAGKSTLTNTLLGEEVQATSAVRSDDNRGRHTTTTRSLHRLAAGGCIIDTPGLRGLQLDLDADTLTASFSDISALARECRFRDCTHRDEPGCAVRDGVHPDRLANYRKMLREVQRDTMTPLQRREAVAVWKARHRAATARVKFKRG